MCQHFSVVLLSYSNGIKIAGDTHRQRILAYTLTLIVHISCKKFFLFIYLF